MWKERLGAQEAGGAAAAAEVGWGAEARLMALSWSHPPRGRAGWTLQPLADELVALGIVANMEDVLEVYQRPYDPAMPQIWMDEQPVQFIKETRGPLPGALGKPAQYDYE